LHGSFAQLSSAVWPFLSTNISLGSVEMHLRGGGIVYYHFTTNQLLASKSVGEKILKILKIGQHSLKLAAKI